MVTKRSKPTSIKKPASEPEKLTKFIKIYLTPSELALLKEVAARSPFRKTSVFARTTILEAIRNMQQQQPNGSAA